MFLQWFLLLNLVCLAYPMGTNRSKSTRRRESATVVRVIITQDPRRTSLACERADSRVMNANWTKDGKPLVQNDRINIYARNMTIEPVVPEDEGLYRCNNGEAFELTS